MLLVTAVVSVLLAVALTGSATEEFRRAPAIVTSTEQVRVPAGRVPPSGTIEVVAALVLRTATA